jgi:hypothetical protein
MNKKMTVGVIVAFIMFAAVSAIYLLLPSDIGLYEKIKNHAFDLTSLLVVFTVFSAFRTMDPNKSKRRWLLLLLGVTCWFIGDLIWTLMVYLGINPFPSIADAAYMVGHACILVATILKLISVRSQTVNKDLFNGIFVGICIMFIVGYTVLMPILTSDETVLNKFVLVYYPIMDTFIMLNAVIIISALIARKETIPWFLICAGITLWTVADSLSAYYSWRNITTGIDWLNILFLGGIHCIGLGAFYKMLLNKGDIADDAMPRYRKNAASA